MAVKERGSVREPGAEAPAGPRGWLGQLDEFGQKHARLILTISAGLIVFTVLIIANVAYKSSLSERVARDIGRAVTVEELKELKERYAGTEELAIVLATLGNRLYSDGRLVEAKKEYDEFVAKFAGHHPLSPAVERALNHLKENLRFEEEHKAALMKTSTLETHPLKDVKLIQELAQLRATLETLRKDPSRKNEADELEREIERRLASSLAVGPIKLPHPQLVFRIKDKEGKHKGEFRVELFEDEAPNTVAALVELAEKDYFKGLKFAPVNTDERLQLLPKQEGAVDYALPFEPTSREGDVGSLIMVRKGEHNLPAEFQILLKSVDQPGDVTICGVIASEMDRETARKVAADDIIDAVAVEKKRGHEYKARTIKLP